MGGFGGARAFYRGLRERLTQYAQAQFDLSRATPDGNTEREHLLAMERQTGRSAPELQLPELPDGCHLIWNTFLELHNARASSGMGPSAIGWQDLLAWQRVRGVQLTTWEIDTLMAIDTLALKTESKA